MSAVSEAAASLFSLPPEPPESHVRAGDIARIGRALIGYRHVSSDDHAEREALHGIKGGCSLNISFCEGERDFFSSKPNRGPFTDLDLKVQSGEDVTDLIRRYEGALTHFIKGSVLMDIAPILWEKEAAGIVRTVQDIVNVIDRSRFMIVRTGSTQASDLSFKAYGGLGRFPKEYVPADGVTLLDRVTHLEIGLSKEQLACPVSRDVEMNAYFTYVAAHERLKFLNYVRSSAFDPSKFSKIISF